MVTIDPNLPVKSQSNLWIVNIKTGIIKALKAALDDQQYPEKKIQGIKISMEYPLEQNLYPHIWVKFSFTKMQQAGIGHVVYSDGTLKEEWIFEGNVTLNIMSLSSYERDVYSSQLIQLLAFGSMNPIAQKFKMSLGQENNIHLTINSDSLILGGQSETAGAPWDSTSSTMSMVYEDTYSFNLVGQFMSVFDEDPSFLKDVIVHASGLNPDGSNPDNPVNIQEYNSNPWQ